MSEEYYDHPYVVDLYDAQCLWNVDNDFYVQAIEPAHTPALDFGSGTGLLAAAFTRAGHTVCGGDVSTPMLGTARTPDGGESVE